MHMFSMVTSAPDFIYPHPFPSLHLYISYSLTLDMHLHTHAFIKIQASVYLSKLRLLTPKKINPYYNHSLIIIKEANHSKKEIIDFDNPIK